ncbi:MAG TPA: hypothetical protein VM469_02890 [Pseudoxanthomonas sp.]|nr:hypothetical protein [Pseudoxanthomonas sp.]
MPSPPSSAPPSRWLAPVFLLLGGMVVTVIWVLLALYLGKQAGWMAWLAAVDAALLLRFGRMRPGARRAWMAAVATLLMAVLANWMIIASQLGFFFGLLPWESALLLRPGHAWTLAQLANGPWDLLSLALAPLLAAWLAK